MSPWTLKNYIIRKSLQSSKRNHAEAFDSEAADVKLVPLNILRQIVVNQNPPVIEAVVNPNPAAVASAGGQIKAAWYSVTANRYHDLTRDMREWDEKPGFVQEDVWASFKQHWETESFQKVRRRNANNRKSSKKGPVHHTGGSVSFVEHAARLSVGSEESILGHKPLPYEVFAYTHTIRHDFKTFVDSNAKKVHTRSLNVSWMKKGRVYGLGSQAGSYYSLGAGKSAHSDVAIQSKKQIQELTSKVDAYASKMKKMQTMMEKWQKSMEMWCKQNGAPFPYLGLEDNQTLQGSEGQNDQACSDSSDWHGSSEDEENHNLG
ncbi:OLC1v1005003C1 [Oldenlandia corymbosa var. corymbosa]|uniref:OLC1v1005003C1 n=1 Tax=Oldenlandia corymbosa var. corymbosa TaxID=529605 RepID=A0AAV1DFM3_OLDCO|nr:OLC1v1005003C1 [Oldenlandia corymbosa var. corymbosa]